MKNIISVLCLLTSVAFGKTPIYDGVYEGVNPLSPTEKIRIEFKAYDDFGTKDKLVSCNMNRICDFKESVEKVTTFARFAPNGDNTWVSTFKSGESEMPLFRIVTAIGNPFQPENVILILEGSQLQVPLHRVK